MDVKELQEKIKLYKVRHKSKIRIEFYEIMSDTVKEGLPQVEVLRMLTTEFEKDNHPLGAVTKKVLRRLRGNASGSSSLAKSVGSEMSDLIPVEEALLISSGEQSGSMEKGWTNAANYVKRSSELRGAILGILAMPLFYVLAFVGLLLFFSLSLLPKFEKSRPREIWPPDAQLLGFVSDNVMYFVGGISITIATIIFSLFYFGKVWTGPSRAKADATFPGFSALAQIKGANFMLSLASFTGSGVSFAEALKKIESQADPYMKWQMQCITRGLKMGLRPEEALFLSSMIHKQYHWIIRVYGMTSSADSSAAYEKIANEMLKRTMSRLKLVLGTLLSNLMLAALAGGVMWIYFSMFSIASAGT